MSAYRKFSDSWEEPEGGRTLGGLATLGALQPSSRGHGSLHEVPPECSQVLGALGTLGDHHPLSQRGGCLQEATHPPPKPPKAPKVKGHAGVYGKTLSALRECCPDHVEPARWQQTLADADLFLEEWGEQAQALRWTARDLFGLHEIPANPHPSYRRLSRYDCTGLTWLLQGCPVVAITEATAAIRMQTGSITTYRKHNKPAYGPLGDSLDDFVP